MNPTITTTFGNPDPNAAPLNISQLVTLLNTLVSSSLGGSYTPYVINNITPGIEDQDKAWIQTDVSGRPIATKLFYSGQWRRIYNGMFGEVRMYIGDPSVDSDWNGVGKVGETYDGWHLLNGKDGAPDWSDKFVVGGHMNDAGGHTGYDSGWQTFVDGVDDLTTGGDTKIQLNATNTYAVGAPEVSAQRFTATGNAPDPAGDLLATGGGGTRYTLEAAIPAVLTPPPIPILPPFIATAYIVFVGYA